MVVRGVFFGWHVVAAAFVIATFAWGICFYGPSVILHAVHVTRGWSVSLISAAITVHFLVSAGLVVYLDDAHRHFGIVATTRAGAVALAGGILGWALAAQPWQLFAAAVLTAAGWSATSGAAITAMVAPWFARRRGFALSLAFNGASMGGVLFIPLWTVLIEALGFPGAAAAIGSATLVVLWVLAGRYLRPTPTGMGLAPDGGGLDIDAADPARNTVRLSMRRSYLLRQPRFLTLSGGFSIGLFAQVGLIAHLVTLLVPTLGESGASGALSLTAVCAVIGRVLLGTFIDRVDRRIAAAGNFAVQVCGVLLLLTGPGYAALMIVGCVLFGLGLGNLLSLPPLIAEAEFDPMDVARVVGLVTAVNQAVYSFAPGTFGALYDATGNYAAPLATAAVLQTAAAAMVLMGRESRAPTSL